MKFYQHTFLTLLSLFAFFWASAQTASVISEQILYSPDKALMIRFFQKEAADHKKAFFYQLSYKGKSVIQESKLDLELDNHLSESAMALKVDTHQNWFENLEIKNSVRTEKDTTWTPVYGERKLIRDHYNSLVIKTVKDDNPIYEMNIEFRAYNQGIAFRFFFPENVKGTYYRIMSENTEFKFEEGALAWKANWAQAPYHKVTLENWDGEAERPLTLELKNGLFVSLLEAQMVDYSRTKFKLSGKNTISTSMFTPVDLISPVATPWRAVMVAETAIGIAEGTDLILNLNEPSKIKDQSWVKPGKIMRVMSQTTKDALENIDFAAKRNLQYILFDWKWYGPAFSFSSDASKVAIADFDLPQIIRYGKEKGIGVWLYVNQQALLMQSDSLFSVYKKWGIAGVKFGFVQSGSHRWTSWVEKAIQQAAQNQIMVNIHDDWRPTGEQRTWPNLMTSEGIRGNEEMPDATSNTVMPFTRYIAGAADYTICYFDPRIKTTHAHQLALAAIYFSPIQTLYWYDKPAFYKGEPELEFWDKIPVSWDETKVLSGKPGEYVTTARRSGEEWFLGSITNNEARKVELKLDFLPKGQKFVARIYNDDNTVTTATKVGIKDIAVDSKTILKLDLQASGGAAIWLHKK
ncbi:Glucan 1,4-alpha-glucosidase SusB [Pedobacter sp. Bi27]|uniref:glycoside hydrolase family 97 protein n=1 Tax=unclassified Pedobacter TaxID=2628915 RepID=UPI001DDAFF46|nr:MULTISPECIES: glycoside hydrolase family 97 protein [unclassified Pedobacter]CAH0274364.1 Glucan 1,4-alpha-glucosidase SusB [Pedobacter sp. Bi36]CAH0297360.1 Glucan 1,4-alpha-glucosidase SusB [Pedobacter sp. Bi126]CAH0310296.1 Glucan 1,4-alpha-glucosidase SusB [Pedobacter sp. Bi27]